MRIDDDAALVKACQRGDAMGWETLVRRYQRLIYTIPRRIGLGDDDAAEVFQRVCVALLENLSKIEQPDRIGAWLATTARRESWRQVRRTRPSESLDQDDEQSPAMQIPDTALLPDELLERIERQHAVRRALEQLDDRCRTLLTLLFYRSDPPLYSDIASQLEIPEGSIGPTRARCLQKLRRVLEGSGA
ncbi:MAG: sigma-70 family RNA polymerase sigma factor [Chloroflexi bacterium]|nr:sigma-70 family RNA polymerase sigma factor [Chloroflexota bacterium]